MANQDHQLIKGIYDLANVQDRLRIYAQNRDYFRFWALRQVNTISILKIISEKFGSVPATDITDWEFRYPEFNEMQYAFHLAEASNTTDASNTKLKFSNEDAAILNPTMRLHLDGVFCKGVVANAATDMATARNVGTGIVLHEELRILHVGEEDSGGAGYRIVIVKRAHPADSYANTAPAITTAMKLTVSNIVVRSNDFPKPPTSKNSGMLDNFIQITRYSYGLGEHMTQGGGIETYLAKGSEYLNIQFQLAETFLMKTIERALLTGRKAKKEVAGNLEYETGGVIEFLERDADHWLDFGGKVPSVPRINNLVRRMADISGVRELWWFTGTELSEQIANAYENKSIYYTNGELSMNYRMKIKTLESVGRDLVVHHVTAPILNELGMPNEGLVLNLSEYNYNQKSKFGCIQVAHKVQFTDKPDKEGSYKSNEGYMGTWRELYGAFGIVRRLKETHFATIGAARPLNA
jgi:hypothetical protein